MGPRPIAARVLGAACAVAGAAACATCGPTTRDEPPAARADKVPPARAAPGAGADAASTAAPADAAPRAKRRAATPALGLAEGATWRFHGTWTRWDHDLGRDVESAIDWTTRVVRVAAVDGGTEHWVEGWPGDAPGAPGRITVVTVRGGVVYLRAPDEQAPGHPWLRLPLRAGATQCDDALGYCWAVEADDRGKAHRVVLRTNPDVTTYRIDPERGVLGYVYHHNGTTEDVVLER